MIARAVHHVAVTASAAALLIVVIAAPMPVRAAAHAVEISDFAFTPATLTITAGDRVTWTNADAIVHTATSTDGAFDSGDLAQGESYSVTFTTPGTYDYLCTPHPTMTGRIVVLAAPAAPSPSAGPTIPDVAMPPVSLDPLVLIGAVLIATAVMIRWRWRAKLG